MPSANFVFPVRYVSEGVAVQSTSRELSPLGIAVRSLAPPQVGARVSMALYLPNTSVPEVAIGRLAKAKRGGAAADAGFWADVIVLEHAGNISRGGIFIQTDDPPPMDAAVQVEIQLPDEPAPVTTNGVVVHRQLAVGGKPSALPPPTSRPHHEHAVNTSIDLRRPSEGPVATAAATSVLQPGTNKRARASPHVKQ